MNEINFCIILYGKSVNESNSFNSIKDFLIKNKISSTVVVFNNGPKATFYEIYDWLVVNQVLINGSLSKIYNKFVDEYPAERYIFLDDDTELTDEYIGELVESDFNILLPKISCLGKIHYPVLGRNGIQSVTSGLALSDSCIKEIKKIKGNRGNVFDERFDLYGIDTAFFYFLNKHKLAYKVSDNIIEHELSHISTGSSDFRDVEVLLANSAALFPYFSIKLFFAVCYGNLKMLLKFKFFVVTSSFVSLLLRRTIRLWKF